MLQKRFVAAAVLAFALVSSQSFAATNQTSCFSQYWTCVNTVANRDSFWQRSVGGLDCAVDLISCVRRAVLD